MCYLLIMVYDAFALLRRAAFRSLYGSGDTVLVRAFIVTVGSRQAGFHLLSTGKAASVLDAMCYVFRVLCTRRLAFPFPLLSMSRVSNLPRLLARTEATAVSYIVYEFSHMGKTRMLVEQKKGRGTIDGSDTTLQDNIDQAARIVSQNGNAQFIGTLSGTAFSSLVDVSDVVEKFAPSFSAPDHGLSMTDVMFVSYVLGCSMRPAQLAAALIMRGNDLACDITSLSTFEDYRISILPGHVVEGLS